MIARPRFKSCYRVEVVEPEGVFVLSERKVRLLEGRLYPLVASQIDGRRSCDEIADLLHPKASPAEVYYILRLLEKSGFLEDSGSPQVNDLNGAAAFWGHLQEGPGKTALALSRTPVSVQALGSASSEPLLEAFSLLEIPVTQSGPCRLRVVLTDDYTREQLQVINRDALKAGQSWMLAKPVGTVPWLGPIFQPGETACWQCLAHYLRANRPVESHLERLGRADPFSVPMASLPTSLQAASHLLATEAARWMLDPQTSSLRDALLTLDLLDWRLERHSARRRPQCPVCGDGMRPSAAPEPLRLQSRPKRYTSDGGHRSVPAQATWDRYRHLISPITGVVGRVLPALPAEYGFSGIYLGVGGAVTGSGESLKRVLAGSGSGGKGQSELAARVSALCEAIERYCGVFQGDEPRLRSRYLQLRKKAVHPSQCLQFSSRQYRRRKKLNTANGQRCGQIPEPFDESAQIEWTPAWSLTRLDYRYLPTAFCYFDYPQQQSHFCWADSNGCAAGNNLEEAILQGFLELAERDSVALWWYSKASRPALELASFEIPYIVELENFYRQLGRQFWVLDVTSDLEIPAFAAVSRRCPSESLPQQAEQIFLGFGAHLNPKTALLRALTEMNQFLPSVLKQMGKESPVIADPPLQEWLRTATLQELGYLAPDRAQAARRCSDFAGWESADLRQDVQECVDRAGKLGMETLLIDQTRPDIGLSVVRVVVPGLRHFWPRFGPGRLYDVPQRLGWIPRPLQEEELNPVAIFW